MLIPKDAIHRSYFGYESLLVCGSGLLDVRTGVNHAERGLRVKGLRPKRLSHLALQYLVQDLLHKPGHGAPGEDRVSEDGTDLVPPDTRYP